MLPRVRSHQRLKQTRRQAAPSRKDSQSGPGLRRVNQSASQWREGPGFFIGGGRTKYEVLRTKYEVLRTKYYGQPASAVKIFTSTRRLKVWFSASDESAGLSQPKPSTLNLLGSNLYSLMTASLTALARRSERSLTISAGILPFIELSV